MPLAPSRSCSACRPVGLSAAAAPAAAYDLLLAAGGGGGGSDLGTRGGSGQATTAGQAGAGPAGGAGGTNGSGGSGGGTGSGSTFSGGGGGAGFLSDGTAGTGMSVAQGGSGPPSFAGGTGALGINGGFGGGGSAGYDGGGGGGGYSGGGGGGNASAPQGGGGGSFVGPLFTSPSTTAGVETGDGMLVITSPGGTATTFGYTGRVVTYTVATAGVYTIAADGAAGGTGYNGVLGGAGAVAGGNVQLAKGFVLDIAVGEVGDAGGSVTFDGAGGGGTFVYDGEAAPEPTSLALLGIGLAGLTSRRPCRRHSLARRRPEGRPSTLGAARHPPRLPPVPLA